MVVNSPIFAWAPGQFLAKDLVLLVVSLWTAGEAWQASLHTGSRHGALRGSTPA